MQMIKVGICLDDTHFAHALSVGLAREGRNIEYILLEQIGQGEMCDLILSSEPGNKHKIVSMVRDVEDENIYGDPPFRVFRYKESHRLVNDLLFLYFKLSGKNLEFSGDTKCRMLVFSSISGGSGCTSASIAVGQMLYRLYGCRCLYLNLCPIDDSKKYLRSGGQSSLLNLLYYLDVQKEFPMGTFIMEARDIDYIQTSVINSYFDEIQPKLLNRLLQKIDGLGKYSFLILDMSNHFSRTNKQMLSRADQMILMYQERDRISSGYYTSVVEAIGNLTKNKRPVLVKNFSEDENEEDRSFIFSKQSSQGQARADGLVDFPWQEEFRMDAAGIAKCIMEEGPYD